MGKKRKPEATRLDEVDRTMYTAFCGAANSLSQLYTQAMHQQRLSFQAGERHGLDKLYSWILRQHENGLRVTTGDIATYLQNELEYGVDDSPRLPYHPPNSQAAMHLNNLGCPVPSNSLGPATSGQSQGHRTADADHQAKNSSVFSNALSSPVRQSLQHYHLSQGGYDVPSPAETGGQRNSENRDSNNAPSSNDSLMDMHADSPGDESPYL